MRKRIEALPTLEDRIRAGSGQAKVEKQHRDGNLTARERIAKLVDGRAPFLEIGLLVAREKHNGRAPAVVMANDATVKAGSWWQETITRIQGAGGAARTAEPRRVEFRVARGARWRWDALIADRRAGKDIRGGAFGAGSGAGVNRSLIV